MKKKIVIGLVSVILMLTVSIIPLESATDEQAYAGNQLRILGLMKGYTDGSLKLDNKIIRAEVAALLIRTLGYSDKVVLGQEKAFTDIEKGYWAVEDIQKAYKLKLIVGDPGGTFRPTENIKYAEVITIMVNALGKNQELEGDWPNNYIKRAEEIGIIPKDDHGDIFRKVTRGEVSVILWDTILVKRN
ncbi:MAG: S-layer homology domain-containing protein [Vallitalea sp.]|nr:S-layer homology domain-containing protein [Vallitalea sp.]